MSAIIRELQGLINIYFGLLVVAIGLFSYLIDSKSFKKSCFYKEEKISKIIGIAYILMGPLLIITLQML